MNKSIITMSSPNRVARPLTLLALLLAVLVMLTTERGSGNSSLMVFAEEDVSSIDMDVVIEAEEEEEEDEVVEEEDEVVEEEDVVELEEVVEEKPVVELEEVVEEEPVVEVSEESSNVISGICDTVKTAFVDTKAFFVDKIQDEKVMTKAKKVAATGLGIWGAVTVSSWIAQRGATETEPVLGRRK